VYAKGRPEGVLVFEVGGGKHPLGVWIKHWYRSTYYHMATETN